MKRFGSPPSRAMFGVIAGAVAVTALGACSSGGSSGDGVSGARDDIFTVYSTTSFTDFDPQALSLIGSSQVAYFAYDMPFLWVDGELKNYAGELVENTANKVSFKLKEGIVCADGHELTPSDAARSLRRTVESVSAPLFFGSGPFNVEADDSTRLVTVETDSSYAGMGWALSQPISMLVCPKGMDAVEKDPDYLKTHMEGSGPYVLDSSVAGASVVFKLREDWKWGPEGRTAASGMPGTVKFQVSQSATAMANELLTNGPAVGSLQGPDAERLKAEKSLVHRSADSDMGGIIFNARPGRVTGDLALRQALGAVLEREEYLAARANGAGSLLVGAFPESDRCYDDTARFPHDGDIAAARKILADAGYVVDGGKLKKDGKVVRIDLIGSTTHNGAGEYVAAQFEELGVEVEIRTADPATYAQWTAAGQFDVAPLPGPVRNDSATSWGAYVSGPASPDGLNRGGFAKNDSLWAEASQKVGEGECEYWAEVQHATVKEAPFVPLAMLQVEWFVTDDYDFEQSYVYVVPQYLSKK